MLTGVTVHLYQTGLQALSQLTGKFTYQIMDCHRVVWSIHMQIATCAIAQNEA